MLGRLQIALATVADRLLLRTRADAPHVCTDCGRTFRRLTPAQCTQVGARILPDCRRWTCSGRLHPVWEPTRLAEQVLRDALAATPMTLTSKNGAPGWTPGTPPQQAAPLGGTTAMTTIIQRRARDVHAGDIIVRDPDHGGLPVRWRVGRRPHITADGVAIIDFTDISDEPRAGIVHYDALVELAVEPVGGAQ